MIITNKVISAKRLEEDANGKKTYGDDFATGIDVYIEPLNEDTIVNEESVSAFSGFKIMSDFTNIIIGDKLQDSDGIIYKVKGTMIYDTIFDKHLEGIIMIEYD